MKNFKNFLKETQQKVSYSRNASKNVFLAITILSTIIILNIIPFIVNNAQTFFNKAASPAVTPQLSQYITQTQSMQKPPVQVLDTTRLEKYLIVEAALLGVSDSISLYFKDLTQQKEVAIDPTRSWIPASTIKAYVIVEAFRQRRVGLIDFNQAVTIQAQNIVPTELETDEFPLLSEGIRVTIGQLIEAMIIQSDNTAYNTLLDILDRRSINETLRGFGLTETVVGEKLNLDAEQFQKDLAEPGRQPNTTTAKDLAILFDLLYNQQIPDSGDILAIFKRQKINIMLPALIPAKTEVAHKTGEWAPIYHDGGVIYKPNDPFVFVVFTNSNEPDIVAKLAHVAYYQSPDSIGQALDRDKAMVPVHHSIAQVYLKRLPSLQNVLGTKTSIVAPQRYVIQEGDSLYSIAQKFYGDGNRWPDIARRNYLSSPTDVSVGQELVIPSVKISQEGLNEKFPTITAADLGITTTDLKTDTQEVKNVVDARVTPGSLAYGIKRLLEEGNIARARTPAEKVDAYLQFTNSRLSETKTLLAKGNTRDIEKLLNDSENALSQATLLAKSTNASQEQFIRIKKISELHFATLAQNIQNVSSDDKEQFIDSVYNFYKKNQKEVVPILRNLAMNNPLRQHPVIGTVDKVTNDTATVKFDNGTTKDVYITSATSIRDFHNKTPDTTNQLIVGEKIAIIGETTKQNNILPVFILRNVPRELPDKHEGVVLRVFPPSNKLELLNKKGETEEIHIDDNTLLRARDTGVSLEGIVPGSQVTVFGEKQEKQEKVVPSPSQVFPTSEHNSTLKLFLPTPTPLPAPKENKPQITDKTEHKSDFSQQGNSTQPASIVKATSVTVTQNGSGMQVQVVVQPPAAKEQSKNHEPAKTSAPPANTTSDQGKKIEPAKGSDSKNNNKDSGKEKDKKDK